MPRLSLGSAAVPAFVLAQIAGLLLADAGLVTARACAGLAASALLAAILAPSRLRFALALLLALGASGFALARNLEAAAKARPSSPTTRTIEGRVALRQTRAGWARLDLEDAAAVDGGAAVPTAIRLQGRDDGTLARFEVGSRLRARVKLEAPKDARNPGARDLAAALARAGIGAVAFPRDPLLVVEVESGDRPQGGGSGWRTIAALRARAAAKLASLGAGGELLRALACGESAGLPDATRRAFAELGLSHLLAVSGLHLLLVAGLAYAVGVALLRRMPRVAASRDVRRSALAVAFAAAAFYAAFSGFGVPVQRSLVFVASGALALARRRPLRARSALAAAALLVLALEPEALFLPGAQLSFAASAALIALRREEPALDGAPSRIQRLLRSVRSLLSTSAAATCATAPLVATHLGVVAPYSLVTNLVFVPWTGLVLLPAALAAAALATLPGADPFRDAALLACVRAADLTCAATLRLSAWLPQLPPRGAPGGAVLLVGALLVLGATRARRLALRVGCAALSCAALLLAPAAPIEPLPPRAVFLDVGQGDATLVQGRAGTLLVDAGLSLPDGVDLGRSTVVPALAALGVRWLDLLLVTHGDADHRGGAPAVLERFGVGAVWLPPGARADPAFHDVLEAAARRGVVVTEVHAGDAPARFGDLVVTPLWPPDHAPASGRNDGSLVVRVEVAGVRVLLPGDIEGTTEALLSSREADLRSDLLKLAHHGSRTSSIASFLAAVGPRLAIASAPCDGRFGMPAPDVVARLDAAGVPWRWTGRDGALLVALRPDLAVRAVPPSPLDCLPGRRRAVESVGVDAPPALPAD